MKIGLFSVHFCDFMVVLGLCLLLFLLPLSPPSAGYSMH